MTRRLFALLGLLVSSCALQPLPAQRVEIPLPDTVTIEPEKPLVLAPKAFDTIGRRVSRARFLCEAVEPLSVRGDTLRLLARSLDGLYTARCTWLRTDGQRPADSIFVRTAVAEEPAPEPEPEPTPDPEPAPEPTPEPSPDPTPPDTTTPVPPDTASPVPPLPPDTSSRCGAACPNEPAGFVKFNDRPFRTKHPTYCTTCTPREYADPADAPLAEGWTSTEGSNLNSRFTIVADASAPSGDSRVGEMFYPAGMHSGVGPATATFYFPQGIEANRMPKGYVRPAIREIYLAIWMQLSQNFDGNDASINKMLFTGVSGGNNQGIFVAYGRGAGLLRASFFIQGVQDTTSDLANRRGAVEIVRGKWQRIEIVLKCNSRPGAYDGAIQLWVDGVQAVDDRDVNWTKKSEPTRACTMEMLNWNPTYGGGGDPVPYAMYQRFDRVYISGR